MSDKELLEMAAKAAGIDAQWDCPERGMMVLDKDGTDTVTWNPLIDDGDALRLACDLALRVYPVARTASGAACSAVGSATSERLSEVADTSLDTRSATRRAITRAAAAIGRAMT